MKITIIISFILFTDEYWINYQKGKGSEEFQKYMEDLTDMQNHVLPYLQSFCNLEEKGVKERREQQIAERYEGRADERVTSTEANAVVKDVGKQIENRHSRSRREMEKIRNYPFMNDLRLIRGLFKKSREKISLREGLIGV